MVAVAYRTIVYRYRLEYSADNIRTIWQVMRLYLFAA